MKKVLLSLLLASIMFVGCTRVTYDGKKYGAEDIAYLELIAESSDLNQGQVYKDRHTGVLYYYFGRGFSPIMKADGTCLTYDEWLLRIKDNK